MTRVMSKFKFDGCLVVILAALVHCEEIGKSIQFLKGSAAVLPCQYGTGHVSTIIWSHQNGAVWDIVLRQNAGESTIIGNRYSSHLVDLDEDSTSLIIRNLSILDDGYYKCTVLDSVPRESFLQLHVIVHPVQQNPVIHQCNAPGIFADCEMSEPAGSPVHLSCQMQGFHPADGAIIEWRRESDHSLLARTSIPTRNDDNTYSLQSSVNVSVLVPERLWCNASYLSEHGTQRCGSSMYLSPIPTEEMSPSITQCEQPLEPGKCMFRTQTNVALSFACEIQSVYVPQYVSLEWRGQDGRILPSQSTSVSKNNGTISTLRVTVSVLTAETETLWCNVSYDHRVGLAGSGTTILLFSETSSNNIPMIISVLAGILVLVCAMVIGVRFLRRRGETHIGLLGAPFVGKSSLINTVWAVLNSSTSITQQCKESSTDDHKEFIEKAPTAPLGHQGGYTKWRQPVRVARHIIIRDNRGWDDWTNDYAWRELAAQINGTASGWKDVNWEGELNRNDETAISGADDESAPFNYQPPVLSPKLTNVILVLKGTEDLDSMRGTEKMRETILRELGRLPIIVVTHADKLQENDIARIKQRLEHAFNVENERIFFIENVRKEKPKVEPSSRDTVLQLIKKCIGEREMEHTRLEIQENERKIQKKHKKVIDKESKKQLQRDIEIKELKSKLERIT